PKAELAAKAAAEMPPATTTPMPPAPAVRTPPGRAHLDTYTYMRAAHPTRKKPAPMAEAPMAPPVHWSYAGEGGPANWAKLRPDYATCGSGQRQSPIDIRDGIRVDLEPIKFDYKPTQFRIVDNGHTVQVNVGAGSTISVMGRQFELVQLHFHRPAEERINGKAYDMVVHLVHKDLDNHLAVIAVLLESGSENPVIQTFWNNLPLEVGQDVVPSVAVNLNGLLPENRNYWTYMGSLTTPPCTEDVLWMVLKQPVQVSPEQIAIFSRLYRNNARPIQPGNNRLIKESR
ncbi:MAG: carbonic anhydrase family protein, partial [Betaproteobacteria bacterium]|nr:carbonic anhydrase family protein [Betaproteobacteria bacterium]